MKQAIVPLVLLWMAVPMRAQLNAVVANMETLVPIRDAVIYTDQGSDTLSIWDGTFCLRDSFGRLTISHPHYVARVVNKGEFRDGDTILLIPKQGYLGEVEVWGRKTDKSTSFHLSKRDAHLLQSQPQGFNLLGLVRHAKKLIKGDRDKESKDERRRRVLDEY